MGRRVMWPRVSFVAGKPPVAFQQPLQCLFWHMITILL